MASEVCLDVMMDSPQKMKESLKTLFRLDPSIFVFCGHDRTTSIGYESQYNRFLSYYVFKQTNNQSMNARIQFSSNISA